jgi:dipeptidyl aminopeptidase/acylaminoacyl peptidase
MSTPPLRRSLAAIAPVLLIVAIAGTVAPPAAAQVSAPDGRIAFQSNADGDWDIWTMNPDGSDLRNLTSDGETGDGWGDSQPSWSPDGSRIAFVSDRAGGTDIFVMGADGSDVTRLTVKTTRISVPTGHPTALDWCSPASGTMRDRRSRTTSTST